MNSIREMIDVLQTNPSVVGLIEYGHARHEDECIAGDYDLIAILKERDPDVESIHFYVAGTPVDLSLRNFDDIRTFERAEGFESVLLDARIIHDPSGEVTGDLHVLRKRHEASAAPELSQEKIGGLRHGAKHTFDKLEKGRNAGTTLARYMLHQLVYWALPQYFEIRGLEYQGERRALAHLEQNKPELHDAFEKFYATADYETQLDLARTIEEMVLEPIGGLWRDDEVVTFGDQIKGKRIYGELFGGTPRPLEEF
ncbi:hypothetical protein ACFL1X_08260 [Candidatus Hydrogenedentota bacterium]